MESSSSILTPVMNPIRYRQKAIGSAQKKVAMSLSVPHVVERPPVDDDDEDYDGQCEGVNNGPPGYNRQARSNGQKTQNMATLGLQGFVGFSYLPNQVHGNALKRGFEFTIMVVGQSGLGKSTLMNTLFMADIYDLKRPVPAKGNTQQPMEETVVQLVEHGVRLTLTLVDTPGFGDAIDNNNSWVPIAKYIDRKYAEYFDAETKIDRPVNIADQRVHCCLYFIPPYGSGLRPLDIKVLKALHDRVNIVPIIAKADTLLPDECRRMKAEVMSQIAENNIQIYDFPDLEDGSSKELNGQQFKSKLPFAVVGSADQGDVRGKRVRCRKYPWGTVEVENVEHNDFVLLKNSLIKTYMLDLVDVTTHVHYENFRCRQMLTNGDRANAELTKDPFTQMEEERKAHQHKLVQIQSEINEVFEKKIVERLQPLEKMEKELATMMAQFEKKERDKRALIDDKARQLVDDMAKFKQQYPTFPRYTSVDSLRDFFSKKRKHLLFV